MIGPEARARANNLTRIGQSPDLRGTEGRLRVDNTGSMFRAVVGPGLVPESAPV